MSAPVYGPYRGKRAVDLAVTAIVGIPALVVCAVCAVLIRLTSKGPVLFRQQRVGLGGREFEVVKFRTMIAGDNPVMPEADRITPVGRWLRRSGLDELPQLLNVCRGEMSVVGPRPTLAYQVARYDQHQRTRLCVRPGLTGLAQVRGRNTLTWGQRIDFDIEYVKTQSPKLDVQILLGTIRPLLTGEGAEGHPTDDPLARPDRDDETGDGAAG